MFVVNVLSLIIGLLLLNPIYSSTIPFEILRSCIDLKPKNDSIKMTRLLDGLVSEENEEHCEDQFGQQFNNHYYGMVTCGDVFYLIIKDQKIRADNSINMSINPEIQPGLIFSNRAFWTKIDQDNKSYLCIDAALTESGTGSHLSQYYIVDNAFDPKEAPVVYYYFFEKNIIPITSEHF